MLTVCLLSLSLQSLPFVLLSRHVVLYCACLSVYSLLFPGVIHELFQDADFCPPRFSLSARCILGGHTIIYRALTGGSSAGPEVGHGSFGFLFPVELDGQLKERSFWN